MVQSNDIKTKKIIESGLYSIYDNDRKEGNPPEHSATLILKLLTNGKYIHWSKEKYDRRIEEIIEKFEKQPQNND
jgi:hypothetical protein